MVINRLQLADVPLVLYTDSRLLYEYLVKLGIINEKCLIIDIITLKELYKNKKINEIR